MFLRTLRLKDAPGLPGGLEIEEAVRVATALVAAGADALVPSGGLVPHSAFFLLRGAVPLAAMAAAEESALQRLAVRTFGPWLVRSWPYSPSFFRDDARRMLEAVDVPVALLGGVDSAAAVAQAMADGFGFVAMGRALLADPDFIPRLAAGEDVVTRCTRCNECIGAMDAGGVRCTLDD